MQILHRLVNSHREENHELPQPLVKTRANFWNRTKAALSISACATLIFALAVLPVLAQQGTKPPQQPRVSAPPTRPLPNTPQDAVAEKVGLDTSPSIFAVMCALWAAGYNAQASTDSLPPAWRNIAEEMFAQTGPAAEAVRKYYAQHEHRDTAGTLSRFISFALSTSGPPDFRFLYRHEDLPPDVLQVEDFNEIMAKFYAEAQVASYWRKIRPAYGTPMGLLQPDMTRIVTQATGFMRQVINADTPRTFQVYIEPLVGNSSNFRNYGDHYYFVVNGDAEPPVDKIRHAFLHYLVDPLPAKYVNAIEADRPLFKAALNAPRLPAEFRDDFQSYYGECVIKAIEIQLDHPAPAQRAAILDAADADGFVLVRPLVPALDQFRAAEPAMQFYFPTLVQSINVKAEVARVQGVKFAPATAEVASTETRNERDVAVERAEQYIARQDGPGAKEAFERILQRWPDTPRATFGLAIASVLVKDEDNAKKLFSSLTGPTAAGATAPDSYVVAWSHIYLARIHDTDGNHFAAAEDQKGAQAEYDAALIEYNAALAVDGAPDAARAAAQTGIEKARQRSKSQGQGDHPGANLK